MTKYFTFAIAVLFFQQLPAAEPDPLTAYESREIAGFRVRVNQTALAHADDYAAAVKTFEGQVTRMQEVVPAAAFARISMTPVWIEWRTKPNGAAEYHVSKEWLKDNGYLVEKANSIEINNLKNFVTWSRDSQPWMLLHELAHAYHHEVLGEDHAPILAAFKQAQASGKYESVARNDGRTAKHYALTNHKEYFAELSESYFGRNDFFPFTRADLERFDPAGYQMIVELWHGKPPK